MIRSQIWIPILLIQNPDMRQRPIIPTCFQIESGYSRWQLLDPPISLDSFNNLPHLTGMFFEYSLRLGPELETPLLATREVDVNVWAWEAVRYKYKFYRRDEVRHVFFTSNCMQVRIYNGWTKRW